MDRNFLNARLVNAAMRRHDAKKEEKSTRDDSVKNTSARAKLKAADYDFNQACENYEKSGCQP